MMFNDSPSSKPLGKSRKSVITELKCSHCNEKMPKLDPILSHFSAFAPYVFQVHFNIILLSMRKSSFMSRK
jgi:protein-disulfide isomerase